LASVDLRGLTKRFGAIAVVDQVSLRIDHGQLVCLLGPSGCGKTTTLRLIAEGVDASALDRVKAPAGLDLGAITPEEIAMSILAEMTMERRRGQSGVAK